MGETLVVKPLSGEEIKDQILFDVMKSLEKTCNLADATAYGSYEGEITIRLRLNDLGRITADGHVVKVGEREVPAEVPEVVDTINIEAKPPNVVRMEHEQPETVLTEIDGKLVERNVYRKKPQERKQKIVR